MVAVGLILGGALTHISERLDLPTPGFLARRPSGGSVEKAMRAASTEEAEVETTLRTASAEETGQVETPAERAGVESAPTIWGAGRADLRGRRLGPIDINSASVEELQKLDGIGPALASRIVELRNRNGPFRKMEDLLEVKGIGPATLARIRASAGLGRPQNTLRTSTSTQADSSALQR